MISKKSLTAGFAAASLVSAIGLAYAQTYDEPVQQDAGNTLNQAQQDQQMDRSQTQAQQDQNNAQTQSTDTMQADQAQSRIAADEPAAVPPVNNDYTMPQSSDQPYNSEPALTERAPQADRN